MSIYGGLGINKVFSFNKIDIGGSLAVWKQPELLSDYPATAVKMGEMVKLDLLYHITDHLKVSMDIAYK
ncbi:hypothetical protein CKC_05140 [Candidatus Liberibacter solanacearum CLso-ZC1]|uniref:Uncharacterized protein n=1 Tax=Liberibacter solanacearum (strain CLso-ZC1) TaxID=658172 RepID=E4UDU6_LIBSC|nr:hypothetical protein [Candidatus Liberibacter solanacearum]ADR52774.1 hypothetical protein CKC_05140 [Candidatus Liberibacter solanacearum CLso-ZC1]